jgi:hypothetical protein
MLIMNQTIPTPPDLGSSDSWPWRMSSISMKLSYACSTASTTGGPYSTVGPYSAVEQEANFLIFNK